MSSVVTFEHVSKRYRLGRERINLRAIMPGSWGEPRRGEFHTALTDLDLQLEAGRSLGLIGPNGAGKSTALKLVAGVIAPTSGTVTVRGKTASLIELGAGFHTDMTGRENIYFSAAVLGLGPRTLRSRFEEIVDFADIGPYIDTPVKRYSSGMLARLGFSVASHFDADVLVLDEVLAVGDAAFQRRCHQRIAESRRQGTALLYVTHALYTLPMLCEEAILLANGTVQARGHPDEVVQAYERLHQSGTLPTSGGSTAVFTDVGTSDLTIPVGGSVDVDVDLDLAEGLPYGHLLVSIADEQMKVHGAVSSLDGGIDFSQAGHHVVHCRIEEVPLQPGPYLVYIGFFGDHRLPPLDDVRILNLKIEGRPVKDAYGVVRLPSSWSSGA